MALMKIVKNPMEPFKSESVEVTDGSTIRQSLKNVYGEDFVEFPNPTVLSYNGCLIMRAEWDEITLKPTDIVGVITLAEGVLEIILIVVAVISLGISLYTMSKMDAAKNGFDAPAPDPTYSLSGQKNDFRLMEPIEVNYGRNRVWCTYAAKPFNRYIGNDQWLYQLFCIGQGSYEVNQIFIEDTDISNYSDVEYEIIPPNGVVTLIETNVETSPEARDIELFGPNESQYAVAGPFSVVSSMKRTKKIEVDLVLPNGCYYTGDSNLESRTVSCMFEYRAIDDVGNPLGDWVQLFSWTRTLKTTTPQRFTVISDVPEGRYQVRGKRTNDKDTSYRAGNVLKWDAVRAIIPDSATYGDVTLLAVKAKATNNLNNDSSARINVDCTRLLKTRSNGVWSGLIPTRSVTWAFYDVMTSKVYGAGLPDSYIDIDELERLDGELAAEGRYFDGIFSSKTTIWDALQVICKVARGKPTINGTVITIVRDMVRSIPQGVFTVDNIIEGSFEWEIAMWDPTEADSVEVTYVDPLTYLQESINCKVVDSDGLNPEKVDLVGCTDRNIAYREGMFLAMSAIHRREAIRFKTGLEGILPMYGDLIAVQYPIPSFGQASVLIEVFENLLVLEDDVEWTDGQQHFVMIRGDNGVGYGPYPVSRGTSPSILVLSNPLNVTIKDGFREPPIVSFGGSTTFARLCTVTEISPDGGEAVSIECRNYNPIIFSHDNDIAPPVDVTDVEPLPDLPVVPSVTVTKVPDIANTISVTWTPALGVVSYSLEQSQDGETWSEVVNTNMTSWSMQVFDGMLYLRVAGVGTGRGPWTEWSGVVGDAMSIPQSPSGLKLSQEFTGKSFTASWSNVVAASVYKVEILNGTTVLRSVETSQTNFTYTYEMAQADGVIKRDYIVKVYAINQYGTSTAASLIASNSAPSAPIDVAVSLVGSDTNYNTYKISWALPNPPLDLAGYKVYVSATNGFTPDSTTLKYTGTALSYNHQVALTSGTHAAQYVRVGSYDVWGTEVTLANQVIIPADTA